MSVEVRLAVVTNEGAFVVSEFFEQIINFSIHGTGYVAATVADAMVGDTILWEIVGSDFLATITRPY